MDVPSSVTACIPDSIDLGFCPVHEATTSCFTLENPSRRSSSTFRLENNSPFHISPESGTLPPKGKQSIHISYTPPEANVIVATVVFTVSDEPLKVLKLSAIGKYSYIVPNKTTFHFGDLLIGECGTKSLIIKNQSQVSTSFQIEEDLDVVPEISPEFPDHSFSFDVKSGQVPAGATFLVKIKFTPTVVYMLSSRNFILKTNSGNCIRFTCLGSGMGLDVGLSSKVCNFGEVRSGNTTSRLISIQNNSATPCAFKFFVDDTSIFRFKIREGTVKGKSYVRIVIYFSPKETVAYYQRVFCMVKNHYLLYLDAMGTAYDILQRPIPLSQRDIENFRAYVLLGEFAALIENQPQQLTATRELYAGTADSPVDEFNQIALHRELFQENSQRLIGLSEENLDFGFCPTGRSSEARAVTVHSHVPFPIYILWLIPGVTQCPEENPSAFTVQPLSATISPNGTFTFQVSFAPYMPASYFYSDLTCQVYIKRAKQDFTDEIGRMGTSESYTLDKSKHTSRAGVLAVPPLAGKLPVVGHSFPLNFQTFIPDLKASPKRLVKFPPCSAGDSMYQSLQIYNTADTPCFYKVLSDTRRVYRVYPSFGLIQAKSFTLLAIEFNPKVQGKYEFKLKFLLNHSNAQGLETLLYGVCCDPAVFIDNGAKLFYPPLFTGVPSKQKIGILNSSHIPVDYSIEVPEQFKEELQIEPSAGIMYPHEKIYVDCCFTPLREMDYKFNIPIKVKRVVDIAQDGNFIGFFNPGSGRMLDNVKQDSLEKQYHVTVVGCGGQGCVQLNPKHIDFETVSVGFSALKSFTLSNVSNCAICVKLMVVPKNSRLKSDRFTLEVITTSFIFDFSEGMLAANSNQKVNLRFVPNCRSLNEYYIVCLAKQTFPNSIAIESPLNEEAKIALKAHGDFPVITILDIRNRTISTARLWTSFNLTPTIDAILSPLTPLEIKFNNSEIAQSDAQNKLHNFVWDFGKVCYNRNPEPRRIRLTLKNVGGVIASFRFLFPDDNKLDKEPWADEGDPEPETAFEEHILDNKTFQISPKEGTLECDQLFDLELIYNPFEVAKHHLNIIFQIIHGKPIVLTLKGETLPQKHGELELRSSSFEFEPLPIGLSLGITQPIELRNTGDAKLLYEIDGALLSEFSDTNHAFPVFEVNNREGMLDPSEITYLECMFKPLEPKEYSLALPILVKERGNVISTLLLHLKGTGYHPHCGQVPPSPTMFNSLPICRQSYLPGSGNAGFSVESIDFEEAAFGTPAYQLVVLFNKDAHLEYKFHFKSSDLFCGDDLVLQPISGVVPPNSQVPVKLLLNPSRLLSFYEGELECVIEWDAPSKTKRQTSERVEKYMESLFLRVRKRTRVDTSFALNIDNSEPEIIRAIFKQSISNILSDPGIFEIFGKFEKEPRGSAEQVDSTNPPCLYSLFEAGDITEKREEDMVPKYSQDRLFLMEEYQEISNLILEGTVFNVVTEAVFSEADLLSVGRTYVRVKPSIE